MSSRRPYLLAAAITAALLVLVIIVSFSRRVDAQHDGGTGAAVAQSDVSPASRAMEAVAARSNVTARAEFIATLTAGEIRQMFGDRAAHFPNGISREWQRALLRRWTELEPEAAMEHARTADGGEYALFVFGYWAQRDAGAAAAWLRQSGDAAFADAAMRNPAFAALPLAAAFALLEARPLDAETAEETLKILSNAPDSDVAAWLAEAAPTTRMAQMLIPFCQLNPERGREVALDYARRLPEGPESDQLLNVIVSKWASTEPVDAAAWLEQLPDSARKTAAWASVTAQWAEAHPAQAAQIAAELPPGPVQHQAVISAVSGWARRDPKTAATWVAQFPEGVVRNESMEQLVFAWTGEDPQAAARWIAMLPPGPSRDAAVKTFRALNKTLNPESVW